MEFESQPDRVWGRICSVCTEDNVCMCVCKSCKAARANGGQKLYYLKWLKGYPMSTDCGGRVGLRCACHVILMPFFTRMWLEDWDVKLCVCVYVCVSLRSAHSRLPATYPAHSPEAPTCAIVTPRLVKKCVCVRWQWVRDVKRNLKQFLLFYGWRVEVLCLVWEKWLGRGWEAGHDFGSVLPNGRCLCARMHRWEYEDVSSALTRRSFGEKERKESALKENG